MLVLGNILLQNKIGIVPFSITTSAVPDATTFLFANALSDSQMEIHFAAPNLNGSVIDLYKIEWTSGNNFGTSEVIKIRIERDTLNDMLDTFRLVLTSNPTIMKHNHATIPDRDLYSRRRRCYDIYGRSQYG